MSKLAVKYNNDLNTIPLRNFSVSELNIFFTICANIKEKQTNKVVFTYDKLRDLSNYQFTGIDRFTSDLKNTYEKLISVRVSLENEKELIMFNLFSHFRVDKDNQTVEIAVNEYFEYILNDLNIGNFTRFPLIEYTGINSTYTKALYTHLKQWKSTGKWDISIQDFRELLQIPKSYRMTDIDRQIINPAIKELKPFFTGLKVFKLDVKGKLSGKGKPVKTIRFTFQQQNDALPKISSDKHTYGIHSNIMLTDKEIHTIIYDWHVKYLIDEASEWKLNNPSDHNNRDFDLIAKFKENKRKDIKRT